MKIEPRRFFGTKRSRMIAAVVAPLLVVALAVPLTMWAVALPADAAFRANGEVMTRDELAQRIKLLGALYGISEPDGAQQQDEFRRDAAKMIAVTAVIDHAAEDRHIVAPDQAVQAALDKLIAGLNPPGMDSFITLLEQTGASRNDVLDELKRQIRTADLVRQVIGQRVKALDEADFRGYYQQHAEELAKPEQRHLRNIVVQTQEEAAQVADRARTGTDFGALAQENSLDQTTSQSQGDLGLVTRSRLEPGYAQVAFSAPQGAIFGPVQTSSGWNVGRVDEIQPAVPQSYEQARTEVVELVRSRRVAQTWNAWLAGQVEQADIEYADEYSPTDADAPSSGLPGQPAGASPTGPGPVGPAPGPGQPELSR